MVTQLLQSHKMENLHGKLLQDADWNANAPGGKVPTLHEVCMPASQNHWTREDQESWSTRWQVTRDKQWYDAVCSGPLRVCFNLTYASWHVKWSSFGLILEKLICFLASVVMGTGVEPWKRFCSNCDYWNKILFMVTDYMNDTCEKTAEYGMRIFEMHSTIY